MHVAEFPDAWELERAHDYSKDEGEDESDSESKTLTETDASAITGIPFLIDMLEQFREDPDSAELIDAIHSQHATLLLRTSPALLLSYLTHRKSPHHCSSVWHALLSGVARLDAAALSVYVRPLLDAVQRGVLPEYLKPREREVDSMVQGLVERALARDGSDACGAVAMQVLHLLIREHINTKLGVSLCTPSFRPLPEDVLEMVWKRPSGITFDLRDIFPSARETEQALCHLSPDPIHPSLAVVTPLIPPSSAFTSTSSQCVSRNANGTDFDKRGFSSYARIVSALLHVFIEDRQVAKQNLWALRHFLALELYAQDFISVPGAWSRVFAAEAIHARLETLVVKVEQIAMYVLTLSTSEGWREAALAAVIGSGSQPSSSSSSQVATSGPLPAFLVDTIQRARDSDWVRETRILRNVLQHVFYDVDREEADRWLVLARKIEGIAPETSMAIVYSVTSFAPEPTRLDRYRNELAASLLGAPSAKANSEGLLTLRKLCACAPSSDTDVVFLPQPRAVNIKKSCQQWIASDEDVDEEVVSAITAVGPILQNMSGAHWELMFDH
ncbi:hypothetical protein C0993_002462 [Termitomyces sp. T159_Od127]|nr:hypothetical protein C0993_002462 [Termitomyces sp. T159_Od127]